MIYFGCGIVNEEDEQMLKRKILSELKTWKNSENKKCIVIRGPRQVGKTYIARCLGEEYESFIEINFYESPELKNIFTGNLDVNTMLLNMSALISGIKMIPGRTLILLDEIQECPEAVTSLKFWSADSRYDVIATGSSLGMEYKNGISYPVGSVETKVMYSLDFEEFLWANSIEDSVIKYLRSCFANREAVSYAIHERMMQLLREYMTVGGMPAIVSEYVSNRNLNAVDRLQRQIYSDYISDIAHYAPPEIKIKAEKCYRSIADQLSKENHKFQYKTVEEKGSAQKFESSVDWLLASYLAVPVYNISNVDFPMEAYREEGNFRIYPTDIGLLMASYPFVLKGALREDNSIESPASNIMIRTAKGGLYEALAADMLVKRGYTNLFFLKDAKSTREIEFLITNADGIVPVEIKAGRSKANSLGKLLENELIPYGYKLASQNVGVSGKRITLPLYMLMFL